MDMPAVQPVLWHLTGSLGIEDTLPRPHREGDAEAWGSARLSQTANGVEGIPKGSALFDHRTGLLQRQQGEDPLLSAAQQNLPGRVLFWEGFGWLPSGRSGGWPAQRDSVWDAELQRCLAQGLVAVAIPLVPRLMSQQPGLGHGGSAPLLCWVPAPTWR